MPYLKILKKRNLSLLFFAQIISQFGDRLTQMALIGLASTIQPNSSLSLAKLFTLATIPTFLISPIAGVYVDRWNKRKTLYISDFLRGIFILLIPLVVLKFNSLTAVYILIFLSFCIGRFFIPAKMSVIPLLVNEKELFLANSLFSVTAMIAAVLGLGIGGAIVELWGVNYAFILDSITFIISALLIILITLKEETQFNPKDIIVIGKKVILNVKNSFSREIKEGFAYLLSSYETRYALKVKITLFSALGSLWTVFIIFIQTTLSTKTMHLGWLAVGTGAGLFLGTIFYGRTAHHLPIKKTINFSMIITSLFLIMFVYILKQFPNKHLALLLCIGLGFIVSPIEIALNTLIHQEGDNNFFGRVFSSIEVIIHLAFILCMFISSYLLEKFNLAPFTIIVNISIMLFVLALFNLLILKEYD